MAREYTEAQKRAILAEGQNICVAAGAGSGKTGVLVERFVRIVTQGSDAALPSPLRAGVEDLLVITFTEKATKEMKARIVEELTRRNMIQERRQVETAYISTIHGFCSRLLQENPFEAGVDPNFTVLDEPQARRLLRQCFESVVAQAYETGDAEIIELIAEAQKTRQYGEEGGDPLSMLAGAAETVLAKLRGAGVRRQEAENLWLSGRDRIAAQALEPVWSLLTPLLDEIHACIAAMAVLHKSVLGTMEVACRTTLEQAVHLSPRTVAVTDLLGAMETIYKAVSKARSRYGNAPPQEMELALLFARIKTACEEATTLFGAVAAQEERAVQTSHRFWGLICAVWNAYDAAKRRRGQLDNDDLQAEGVRLLEDAPGVRLRYSRRFRHLMVDEFQDTNPLQMRLIELLQTPVQEFDSMSGKIHTTDVSNNFLFVVGDVQQSIYAFRNADPTLFRELERDFREKGVGLHVQLADNFRSRSEILRLVEQIFKQAWREEETPFVPLRCGAPFDPKPIPSIEILLTHDLSRRDYVRLEADALAARIQQMVEGEELRLTSQLDPRHGEPVSYRDIAVLLRGLTDIQKYEAAFARRGVPFFVVGGGRGYYARHEIRDLLNILTVLDTPLDDVALTAALRSPLVGVEVDTLYHLALQAQRSQDAGKKPRKRGSSPLYPALRSLIASDVLVPEERTKLQSFVEIIESLRQQEDRLPVGHLLERLITQTRYDARLLCRPGGRRRLANVRKLLQMANADSVLGVREFIRRLRDMEKLSDREGDAPTEEEAADVVRFLTIHGAKGLEFPVVVLADLARGLLVPEKGIFVCDPQRLAIGTRLGGEPNVAYKAIVKQKEDADKKEYNRLLYVAMTRAREHLILCGNVGRNRSFNWADQLFPILGVNEAPPEPERRTLIGGIEATLASLSHYVHTSLASHPDSLTTARRREDAIGDRIADAILKEESLDPLLDDCKE